VDAPASFEGDLSSPALWDSENECTMVFGCFPSKQVWRKVMKAIVCTEYGPPDILQLQEVEKPTAKDNEALIGIRAASVVYGDLALVRGSPFVARLSFGLEGPKGSGT